MRILSVTAQKPFSTGSGVYLTELVKGFHALGHLQAVVAGFGPDDTPALPGGAVCYPVWYGSAKLPFPVAGMSDEMPYESTRYRDMSPEMTRQFKSAFLEALEQAAAEFQPDVILCHHLYLLTALCRERFPDKVVAGICHGTGLRQLRKHNLEREYILKQTAGLDRIFSLHGEQKRAIAGLFEIDPRRVTVIGSGYNDSIFRKMPVEREKGRVIYAGKLSMKKGVMSLLRCAQGIKTPVSFHLAGGGGDAAEYAVIRQLAQGSPWPVNFLGELRQQALAEEFCKSDVFVLPSFYEGLPLVIMEALACGLKVVCTDLPGIRDWMDENLPGHGISFVKLPGMRNADEPEEAQLPAFEAALARAIEEAAANPVRPAPALQNVSWKGVCGRLLSALPPLK